MVGDNRFKNLISKADPEVAAQMNYIIAHAANSLYGRTPVADSPTSPKLNPPKTGITSASQSEIPVKKSAKALKDLSQRFKASGTKNDFITLRTLQLKNR
jgi:NCAIR mutase (PurE)-related protein